MSKKQIELNRTVSHHQQSHRFAWWSHVPKSYDGYFQKNVEVWRIIGWLPSQDASDHKDLIVGARLYFHICMMNGFQKTHFSAKKLSCGLGFRHCIVTRICMPTPGFVGIGGSMPAWPSNPASQNRQGPPPDPRNSLHHGTKSRCPRPGALKGHNLDPQLPPCFNPRDFEGTHNPHIRPGRQTKFWTPNNANFLPRMHLDLCRAGTTTPACPEMSQSHPNHNCRLSPCQKKLKGILQTPMNLKSCPLAEGRPNQPISRRFQRAPKPPTFQPLDSISHKIDQKLFSWKRGKRTLERWFSSNMGQLPIWA